MSDFNKRFGLFIAASVLLLLLVFQLVTQTGVFVSRMEAKAEKQEQLFQEVTLLSARIQGSKSASRQKAGKNAITSLLPWLEKETARANFAGHVREIAPVSLQSADSGLFREKATLGVGEISMARALRFLHQLEVVTEIRIVRGDIKRSEKDVGGVTLSMEIGLL